jgi:signal recognition particle receptor subunit beta
VAFLDSDRNCVVVRVVYDGPPGAGKTTSVKILGGSLACAVYSPEELEGRTLYFDWMDCTRGRFGGYDVHFQVVSVPGQAVLAPRRRLILETADAVVFVSDTSADAVAATRSYLAGLVQVLGSLEGPPVGIVVQANKRDVPGAVPLAELRRYLAARHDVAIVESVATGGQGLREALTLSIRLALDRVRELMRTDSLPEGKPEIEDGPELLAYLQAAEGGLRSLATDPSLFQHTPLQETEEAPVVRALEDALAGENGTPERPPDRGYRFDATVPSGMIWPPVTGRMMLHELGALDARPAAVPLAGDLAFDLGPPDDSWRAHSYSGGVFGSSEAGHPVLIEWARMHSGSQPFLSFPRCIVLAGEADGTWRLWQIVKARPSLRSQLDRALGEGTPDALAAGLRSAARHLLAAAARFPAAAAGLAPSLDGVGEGDVGPVYVGLMPDPAAPGREPAAPSEPAELLGRELGPVLAGLEAELKKAVLESLQRSAPDSSRELSPISVLLGELLGWRPPTGRAARAS